MHRSESVGEDPRGSPSSSTSASSEKSKRAAISHTRKGDFVHFGTSLRIMYTAVAHRPTTLRDRGDTTISNRVLPLSFVLSLSLSSFYRPCSFASFLSSRVRSKYAGCPRQIVPRRSVNHYCCLHAALNLPAFLSFVFEYNRKARRFFGKEITKIYI